LGLRKGSWQPPQRLPSSLKDALMTAASPSSAASSRASAAFSSPRIASFHSSGFSQISGFASVAPSLTGFSKAVGISSVASPIRSARWRR